VEHFARVWGVVAAIVMTGSVGQAADLVCCNPGNVNNCDPNLSDTYRGIAPGPPQGPYAASGGAIWVQTAGAAPVAVDFDVNLEFMYSTTENGGYADLVSGNDGTSPALLLLSNHTADNWMAAHQMEDPANGIYWPGYWGIFAVPSGGVQAWGIPGTSQAPGTHFSGWYYTRVRAWTGSFDSYAAAVAGGAYFAESNAFATHFGYLVNPMNVGDFSNMPSMILRHLLPGDASQDGTVNIVDLSRVLADFDKTGMTWSEGDFNNDGTVNIADLSNLLANFDKTLGSPSARITAVPEPSTLLLAIVAVVGLLFGVGGKRA
jgi:hypothetical protein